MDRRLLSFLLQMPLSLWLMVITIYFIIIILVIVLDVLQLLCQWLKITIISFTDALVPICYYHFVVFIIIINYYSARCPAMDLPLIEDYYHFFYRCSCPWQIPLFTCCRSSYSCLAMDWWLLSAILLIWRLDLWANH